MDTETEARTECPICHRAWDRLTARIGQCVKCGWFPDTPRKGPRRSNDPDH